MHTVVGKVITHVVSAFECYNKWEEASAFLSKQLSFDEKMLELILARFKRMDEITRHQVEHFVVREVRYNNKRPSKKIRESLNKELARLLENNVEKELSVRVEYYWTLSIENLDLRFGK